MSGRVMPLHDRLTGAAAKGWLLFFAAAVVVTLLPRYPAVAAGTLFADDFVHVPSGHLLSYRFLDAAELSFWQHVIGPAYLLGILPKIVGAIYSAALCCLLRGLLMAWSVAPHIATAAALLVPLHPIWSTFVLWNVTVSYLLSLVLICLGYRWWSCGKGVAWEIAGIVIVAAGISGYQAHAGLLPALIFAELALDPAKRLRLVWRRVIDGAAAAGLYLLATKIAALTGLRTWGERGLSEHWLDPARLREGVHAMADNIAMLTQPFLSFYFGLQASWKFWWLPLLLLSMLVAASVRLRSRSLLRALTLGAAPVALTVAAAAVILPLSVTPTGPRMSAAIWLAAVLASIPLLVNADATRCGRSLVLVAMILFTMMAVPVTLADATNRTLAWNEDLRTLSSIQRYWAAQGVPPSRVELVVVRGEGRAPAADAQVSRPIVLQNFHAVTPGDYSNVRQCPEWFFRAYGFAVQTAHAGDPAASGRPDGRSPTAEWKHDPARTRTTVLIYAP